MEKNRVFGGRCYESLASYDPESSSWKMSQLSLFEEEQKLLDRLPKSGIARNGQLYPLEILELRISDDDGLLLPTPTAKANQTAPTMRKHWKGLLPTPTSSDPDKHSTGGLHRLIVKGAKYSAGDHRNLPTPTAHLVKEGGYAAEYKRRSPPLICHFQKKDTGERQVLSPLFVEWMMGFPIEWLD